MTFPERLAELRERAGLSRRELSILAELTAKHVLLLERVDRDHSKVASHTLHKLCVVLGCTQDYLWAGTEPGPTDDDISAAVAAARGRAGARSSNGDSAT